MIFLRWIKRLCASLYASADSSVVQHHALALLRLISAKSLIRNSGSSRARSTAADGTKYAPARNPYEREYHANAVGLARAHSDGNGRTPPELGSARYISHPALLAVSIGAIG